MDTLSPVAVRRLPSPYPTASPFTEGLQKTLAQRLSVLKLKPRTTTRRREVLEAYLKDRPVLSTAMQELQASIEGAIYANLLYEGDGRDAFARNQAIAEKWTQIRGTLPRLDDPSATLLDAHQVGRLTPPELLLSLQSAYGRAIDDLPAHLRAYLFALIQQKYVGVIQWTADDVCWYGYFRHGMTEKVDATRRFAERSRFRTTETEQQDIRRTDFVEYHEHHLYDAREHTVRDYGGRVPDRIGRWLWHLPASLADQLVIVDGHVFQEKIIRWDGAVKRFTEQRIIAVHENYDPAVCLGRFILTGWNTREIPTNASRFIDHDHSQNDELRLLIEAGLLP